ncbi:hypothetical protein KBG23_00450 [Candidatus Dojkabacteria bacterium]|jgi:hypothetical protein|nr:hypothetical protein [Candidatus Dojkabacteria bacterium]
MTNTTTSTKQNKKEEEKSSSLLEKISGKKEVREEEKMSEKKEAAFSMLTPEDGINLVPILTKSEVVKEERKGKLNLTAILSVVVFLVITIVVVAFSTLTKLQVENEKAKLKQYEEEASVLGEKVLANDELLRRILLYKDISSSQYSVKDIFNHFSEIAIRNGSTTLTNFIFTSNTSVSFEGECSSLECVAKFWHRLSTDSKVESVFLDSVSKRSSGSPEEDTSEEKTSFEFRVTMRKDAFKKDNLNINTED